MWKLIVLTLISHFFALKIMAQNNIDTVKLNKNEYRIGNNVELINDPDKYISCPKYIYGEKALLDTLHALFNTIKIPPDSIYENGDWEHILYYIEFTAILDNRGKIISYKLEGLDKPYSSSLSYMIKDSIIRWIKKINYWTPAYNTKTLKKIKYFPLHFYLEVTNKTEISVRGDNNFPIYEKKYEDRVGLNE